MTRPWRMLGVLALCAAADSIVAVRTRADAPPGHYEQAADGTVRDTRTRLVWQQRVDPQTFRELPGARAHCEKLQLAGGGWRLPTIKELLTLVDPTRAEPAIDPAWFPDTPAARFLSSTPNQPSPTFGAYPNDAWIVEFKSGATFTSGNNPSDFRVRCVR